MEGNNGYVTYLKLVRDADTPVNALDLGFDTNNDLKPSTLAKFTGWLGDNGYTYQPGESVPASVTQLTAQWEVPYEQHPSLTVGEEYWFDLSGVNKTDQTLNPALPDGTLTWVPFVYMGTVNAYVLNESSDGVTDASDEASGATDSSATYGYTYEHSLFLSRNYLFQNTSATWNDLNGNGLIFGTNMELGGITYRLRAPSGGNRLEYITGTGNTVLPDNNEWSVMRKKAKDQTFFDAIRDESCNAMMQDTAKQNDSGYFSRQWQFDSASSSFDKGNKNNGYYTPVLEIPADADIHPVTVDLGGGSVEEGKGTLKLAVSADGFTAPSTQGISGMSGTLVWQGDNGVVYTPRRKRARHGADPYAAHKAGDYHPAVQRHGRAGRDGPLHRGGAGRGGLSMAGQRRLRLEGRGGRLRHERSRLHHPRNHAGHGRLDVPLRGDRLL